MSSFAEESHGHQAHHTQDRHAEVLIRKSPESFRNRERRRVSGERRAGPRRRDRQVWICAGEGVWGRGWGWRPAGREPGSGVGRRRAGRDGQVRICARGAEAEAGPERWEPDPEPEPAPAFRSSQPAAAAAAQPQRPRPLRADMVSPAVVVSASAKTGKKARCACRHADPSFLWDVAGSRAAKVSRGRELG